MNTVILKWNPSFSSYSMKHFLNSLSDLNQGYMEDYNWSVWDHERIRAGDRFYWIKLGCGQVGIVGAGTILTNPYEGEDWSGKGRRTFYVDFKPHILLNPDALPLLTTDTLCNHIPDFDWHRGHSGLVLTPEQSVLLNKLWSDYLSANRADFVHKVFHPSSDNDLLFWNFGE